jgi:hypothetical protein
MKRSLQFSTWQLPLGKLQYPDVNIFRTAYAYAVKSTQQYNIEIIKMQENVNRVDGYPLRRKYEDVPRLAEEISRF